MKGRGKIARAYKSETKLQEKIVETLNALVGVRCQKIHGSVYGKPTLDILGSKYGRFFWLEIKQPGEKPTEKQYRTMKNWYENGAVATWTDTVTGALKFIESDFLKISHEEMVDGF